MSEPRQGRQHTTLHPLVWTMLAGAGVMLLLLVIGIYILIGILQDSRDHIRAQDAKTAVLLKQVQTAKPAAHEASALVRDARPVVRQIHDAIGPLRRSGSSLTDATSTLPQLVQDARAVAAVGLPVLSALGRTDIARVLGSLGSVTGGVLYRDRLNRALDATNQMLAEVRRENLIGVTARAGRRTPGLIEHLLRLQLVTLRTQKLSLATQRTTLGIQLQALASIKSIDRKTGGTVPAQGAPVPAP